MLGYTSEHFEALAAEAGGTWKSYAPGDHRRGDSLGKTPPLQVIRFDAGVNQGLTASAFAIVDLPVQGASSIVGYVEGILGNLVADDQAQKDRTRAAFEEDARPSGCHPDEKHDALVTIHDRALREPQGNSMSKRHKKTVGWWVKASTIAANGTSVAVNIWRAVTGR